MALLFSCKSVITTVAPSEVYEEVVYTPRESSFTIPVHYSIAELQNVINNSTKGVLYEDNNLDDDQFQIRITKKAPITLSVKNEELTYTVPLDIWVKGGVKGGFLGIDYSQYEEVNASLAFTFKTKISFDPFWNIATETKFVKYDWIETPKFSIPVLAYPFKIIANKIITSQETSIENSIDIALEKNIETRKYLQGIWSYLQDPIQVSLAPATWLKLTPKDMAVGSLISDATNIMTTIQLKTLIETSVGARPVNSKTVFPNYKKATIMNGSDFNVQASVNLPYAELENMASNGLKIMFDKKKFIIIDDVHFYGNDTKMIIDVMLSGSLNGRIYFKGIPVYDSLSRSVVLNNFDFDLETKNKLHKMANWLAHDKLIKKLNPHMKFEIGPYLDDTYKSINEQLNHKYLQKGILVDGALLSLQPDQFFVTKNGLVVMMNAHGKASLVFPSSK